MTRDARSLPVVRLVHDSEWDDEFIERQARLHEELTNSREPWIVRRSAGRIYMLFATGAAVCLTPSAAGELASALTSESVEITKTDRRSSPDDFLTLAEAAKVLRVSIKTAGRVARRGDLPFERVGRSWRIRRGALSSTRRR